MHEWLAVALVTGWALAIGFPKSSGFISWKKPEDVARRALAMVDSDFDPSTRVSSLSRTEKSLVAIARALVVECDFLVLDEPTASLPADAPGGIFSNVSTDAMSVSEGAATWAVADAGGAPGVVIFTDSTYQIAIDKADRIKETIEEMGGTVLEYVDTPIADTSSRMGPLTTSLLQKYGDKWTHALAINDIYFDFMGPALAAAGIPGDGSPKAVAAGDGSESSFQRIKTGQYQSITVAEPLNLQGWQLVDELNRAVSGEDCSGYVTAPAVVNMDGAKAMGDSPIFDPENGYREAYSSIWGK